ncbi:FUSC family protein [Streptomyces sp. bgisy100]|uniref:FUSC family protein n=1 Tax=Streptomyces sp. bgisy100 TaxID=3413783 RepID=UPI003D74AD89
MAEATAGRQRTDVAGQGRTARIRQWLRRAAGSEGHERHTLALIGKATLAACLAWVIAYDVMQAQSPAFAPFSAVLIMQVTVYRSLLQALRYVGAVSVGVALQGLFGLLAGPGLVTFVLVALAALAIGRWRPLGSQGSQVATAAFFAFSTYVSASSDADRWNQLGQIILLVLIGCGVGVVVNMVVLPPMRYRSAESGIHALAHSLCDLVSDIHPALRENELDGERTRHWRERAAHLGPIVEQAQSAVRTARESTYYNPRRLLQRHWHHTSFSGYQAVIDALERVSYQMGSMTRSLDQWHDGESGGPHRDFLRDYGDFLESLARILDLFSHVDEDRLTDQARELCEAADQAQERRTRLVEDAEGSDLPLGDPSRPFGILMVEATRLMDEMQHTCDVLQQAVDRACAAEGA